MSAPLGQGVSNSGGYGRVEVIGEDEGGVDGGSAGAVGDGAGGDGEGDGAGDSGPISDGAGGRAVLGDPKLALG
jgi:hypothetical protein